MSSPNATPIARLFADTMVLTVPASSPIKSIKDLTTQLKANPGSVSWGGGSKGSIDHILAGLIAKEAGVEILGIEGHEFGEWVLVDLADVVVHIMQGRIRDFYKLENLWNMETMPGAGAAS